MFLEWGFSKKIQLSCTSPYEPLTPYKVSEKSTDDWMDRRTDPNSWDPSGHDRVSKEV